MAHMAHQRHRVMKHKGAALRSTYGIANNELSDTPLHTNSICNSFSRVLPGEKT